MSGCPPLNLFCHIFHRLTVLQDDATSGGFAFIMRLFNRIGLSRARPGIFEVLGAVAGNSRIIAAADDYQGASQRNSAATQSSDYLAS